MGFVWSNESDHSRKKGKSKMRALHAVVAFEKRQENPVTKLLRILVFSRLKPRFLRCFKA